ncbi:MAG TPA: ATPase domain-containing protein [Frateuria sp.]|uniref:RAD55 family ATPase n=1 Tax=Frateuria sp. TaxID=2211372 RepID=UPI002D805470|nr:ATPase domain-containing protein [Frateuria sp.]HET6806080.1 ATPase domain-containing protein [Frateuria sp.]
MIEKFSTGIEGLDQLTDGGFLRGSAYIIQGPPGAGKTILANQFCYAHVREGGRALYMTLLAESSSRMLSYVSQMGFFEGSALPDAMQYLSGYGVLEREGLPGLLKLVQHELKRHRATAMVLDGTFVAQSRASEQEFRAFIHALQGVAGIADAVLVMLTHQNRDSSCPEHTMVDGWIELSDETHGFRAYRTIQVRKHRGAAILPGKHRVRITQEGIAVFPRAESVLDATPAARAEAHRLATGHEGLDALLQGGLPAGSATLLMGPTGSGKTTLGLHFLSLANAQEPGLMLGFYETPAHIRQKARSVGLDLDTPLEDGTLELLWLPPAENIVDELVHDIVNRARARKVKRVLVDGLVAIRDSLVIADRMPYVINALSMQLKAIGASVVYTSEIPELQVDEARLPSDEISAMVDNVLLLNTGRRGHAFRRYLSVVKLRDSDFDPRTHEFHVDSRGIAFGPDPRVAASGEAG